MDVPVEKICVIRSAGYTDGKKNLDQFKKLFNVQIKY